MIYRVLAGLIPTLLGWMVFSGAVPVSALLGGASLSVEVPHDVETVASEISDMDLHEFQPGTEGRVALSGNRTAEGYAWTMYGGDTPLLNLVAHLKPSSDGASTKVWTEVVELPGLETPGVASGVKDTSTMGAIFAAALEEELNPLRGLGERLSSEEAHKVRQRKMVAAVTTHTMTHTSEIAADMQAAAAEMAKDDEASERQVARYRAREKAERAGVTFQPGQPMVHPGR